MLTLSCCQHVYTKGCDGMHRASPDAHAPGAIRTAPEALHTDRPDPPVSVHQARLALARTHVAAQEAGTPRASDYERVERKARLAMNLSWSVRALLLPNRKLCHFPNSICKTRVHTVKHCTSCLQGSQHPSASGQGCGIWSI